MVAREITAGLESVRVFRRENSDAYYFNWILEVDNGFQQPFLPTHENVAKLEIHQDMDRHQLAANLRQVFSAIVAGNVKEGGISAIKDHGPFEMRGDKKIMQSLDTLLQSFVGDHRMKIPGTRYAPCYRLIED